MTAATIDTIRGCLAMVHRRGDLPAEDLHAVAVVRGALLLYRTQRWPGEQPADQHPVGYDWQLLGQAITHLEQLAAWPGHTLPQFAMLRDCLGRLRRAHAVAIAGGGVLAARDWRGAQMPVGDRV